MATAFEAPPHAPSASPLGLWSVRIATVVSLLLVVAPAVLADFLNPFYRSLAFYQMYYWVAQVLYLLILGLLWAKPKETGLALAIGTGSVGFVLSAGLLWVSLIHYHGLGPKLYFGLLVLTQAALVGGAIKAFPGSQRPGSDRAPFPKAILILWISFAVSGGAWALFLHAYEVAYDRFWDTPLGVALFALSLVVLAGTSVKAFRSSRQGPADQATLIRGIAIPWVGFALFSTGWGVELHGHGVGWPQHLNDISAIASLRTINRAEAEYAQAYKAGYSSSLVALGPPAGRRRPSASASGLIDEFLASGKRRGYIFTYLPTPRDPAGRITTYTLIGRPVEFGVWEGTGNHNYLSDQSGVIRETSEDRPATVSDPAISGP